MHKQCVQFTQFSEKFRKPNPLFFMKLYNEIHVLININCVICLNIIFPLICFLEYNKVTADRWKKYEAI